MIACGATQHPCNGTRYPVPRWVLGVGRKTPTGDRLVDHHADQVEIGLGRYRISGNLLRGHVAGSADVGIGAALMPATRLGGGRARDTEVSKHRAIRKQEDIARLDVAMDDTGEVHTLEPVQQVAAEFDRFLGSERSAFEPLCECGAFDELHYVVVQSFTAEGVMDRRDVGMTDAGENLRFARERIGGERGVDLESEDLNGDGTLERDVVREEDDSHAAAGELALEAIIRRHGPLQPVK